MPDFKLLRQVIFDHAPILIPMILTSLVCICIGTIIFWFTSNLESYVVGGIFCMFGIFLCCLAVVTNISSCHYYYERALLKKYGVKIMARLVSKADESDHKHEECLYTLDYVYTWQGKEYEGSDSVENKAIFDVLEPGAEIPVIVLSRIPSSSIIQTGRLKWLYQIRNKKQKFTTEYPDEGLSLDA